MSNQEEFKVSGEEVVQKVKDLIHEGNARRIIIKNSEGKTIFEIPLTFGAIGAVLAPALAAVGQLLHFLLSVRLLLKRNNFFKKYYKKTPVSLMFF